MAGPTVKDILLRWGVDVSSWKRAIQDINTLLEQQQSKAAKAQQDYLDTLDDQKASVKELIGLQQDLTEELQRQAQIRSQTKTDDSGAKRAVHEKSTTDHIRSQVGAHKDVQDAAEESGKTAAKVASQQKQIADAIKQQSVELRVFITAQKAVQSELQSTLKQEQLITQEIKKQVDQLHQLSTLRAPTAWKPTFVSTAPAPVAHGTAPTQAPVAAWQSDMAKLQGGLATGALKAGSEETLRINKQIREEIQKRLDVLRQIPALTSAEIAEVNKERKAESFDEWAKPKVKNGYNRFFAKDAEKDIRQVKISNEVGGFLEKLNQVTNKSSALTDVASKASAASSLRSVIDEIITKNTKEATGLFGGFDAKAFQNIQQKDVRTTFGGQLPQFADYLSKEAEELRGLK